jgi:replication fork protection complex subunit Tof1/Swi1
MAKEKKAVADSRFPPDVEVKKGYSWSDQVGIEITCLIDSNQEELDNRGTIFYYY